MFSHACVLRSMFSHAGVLRSMFSHACVLRSMFSRAGVLGSMSLHACVLAYMFHVLFAIFHVLVRFMPCVVCLDLGYVHHAMCYCRPFVSLSFFLVFWPIGSNPI